MKKQYLISLLGLAAISIPLGSSISNASLQSISPAYIDSKITTGIQVEDTSSITYLDNGNSGVDNGDTSTAIKLNTSYKVPSDTVEHLEKGNVSNNGINVYVTASDMTDSVSIAHKTYSDLKEMGLTDEAVKNGLSLSYDINSNPEAEIWSILDKSESLVGAESLTITAEGKKVASVSDESISSEFKDSKRRSVETTIGEVSLDKATVIESEIISGSEVQTTNINTASVDYEIRGTDSNGLPLEITEVKWMNGGDELAKIDNKENVIEKIGTLTALNIDEGSYEGTTLEATINGQADALVLEAALVEDFEVKNDEINNSPTMSVDIIKSTAHSVTFDYAATFNENLYTLESIDIVDENSEDELQWSYAETFPEAPASTGQITISELDAGKTYDLTMNSTFKDKADLNRTAPVETSIPFETTITAPEVKEPTAVKVDSEHNILEVQGVINTNGSIIDEINIVKKSDGRYKKYNSEIESWEQDGNNLTYDIYTSQYIESGAVDAYAIEVVYKLSESNESKTTKYKLKDYPIANITRNEDLSQLTATTGTDKLGAGAVIAIIIAVLLLVGVIAFVGNILYKKYKIDKAEKEEKNNQETIEDQDNDETLDNKDDQHNEEIDENVYS